MRISECLNLNELSLFDYVLYKGNVVRIAALYLSENKNVGLISKPDGGTMRIANVRDIRPIPVTPEFLIDSGFEVKERDESTLLLLKAIRYSDKKLTICFTKGEEGCEVRVNRVVTSPVHIDYIHRLQHLLRFCYLTDIADYDLNIINTENQ